MRIKQDHKNYIHQLQADLAGHIAAVESFKASINHLRNHLHSDKFTGVESDGERKDWISTSDVLSMLWAMESNALDAGDSAKASWKPAEKAYPGTEEDYAKDTLLYPNGR